MSSLYSHNTKSKFAFCLVTHSVVSYTFSSRIKDVQRSVLYNIEIIQIFKISEYTDISL